MARRRENNIKDNKINKKKLKTRSTHTKQWARKH